MSCKFELPPGRKITPAAADGAGVADGGLADLPRWDLSDLYAGPDAPELAADLDDIAARTTRLAERHRGKLATLDGAALAEAIAAYEALDEAIDKIMSYAGLLHAGDMADPEIGKFYQTTQERLVAISSELLFFGLEINLIEEDDMAAKLAAPELAHYSGWLRDARAYRPHQLDESQEKLIHELSVTGASAWNRLFDETMTALRFEVDGKNLTIEEALNLLSDSQEDRRRAGGAALGRVLGDNIRLFAHITNTLAKDKETHDRWRKFARPVSSRNLANVVEDKVVDALVDAVRASYPRLSHRYYKLKAGWLGKEQLDYWDRNAPLPDEDQRLFSWARAVETVSDAYRRFSPELATVGQRFFDADWIDVGVRPGKAQGAFAHPTVPSAHPYLLLNFQGKTRDVMTLAHELGHGVHQVLAAAQGQFGSQTPLTLAETASVFGEMLTFRSLLSQADKPAQRRALLAGKVEDMLNTVVRQIAFYEFERRVHDKRREGELLPDEFAAIWLEVQGESLGPAFRFADEYRYFWTYISHFIHSPFYVYAYAFGDCLVNSLYALYEDQPDGFAERYLDMLRAGGTLRHKELLAPFGLDASDPGFWSRGLTLIEGMIDELEAM